MTTRSLTVVGTLTLSFFLASNLTYGQETDDVTPERVMFAPSADQSAVTFSPNSNRRPSASELRQARALYQSKQRLARLEERHWAGHEPLRPVWNSLPMMSSRYSYGRQVTVPVYFYRTR